MNTENNPFANEIAHYSDKRITEILHNKNDYAFTLVNGCKREAENRNLDVATTLLAGNPFSSEVEKYDDEKIVAMISGAVAYSPKLLLACRLEASKRGLVTLSKNIEGIFSRDEIMQVQQNLKSEIPIEQIKNNLKNSGYSDEESLKLIDKAVNSKELKVISKEKSGTSGLGIFGTLFLVYVIIKWTYIIFR